MRIDKQHRAAETDGDRRPGSPPVVAQHPDSGDNHEIPWIIPPTMIDGGDAAIPPLKVVDPVEPERPCEHEDPSRVDNWFSQPSPTT
jgi:hypothetical protein